jgi:hypothetical protein
VLLLLMKVAGRYKETSIGGLRNSGLSCCFFFIVQTLCNRLLCDKTISTGLDVRTQANAICNKVQQQQKKTQKVNSISALDI